MGSATFKASVEAGRQFFDAGEFRRAHEVWELGWRRTQRNQQKILQVLSLWAEALHHHREGTAGSGELLNALEQLGEVPDTLEGIDLEFVREGLVTSLEHVRVPGKAEWRPRWPAAVEQVTTDLDHEACCPYCGEAVLVQVAPEDVDSATYVEDCPVCCRPWQVQLVGARISLSRA